MANEQFIRNRRGTLLATIKSGKTENVSDLVFHGYGVPEYGRLRDNNLVYLLENFYSTTAPSDPIEGQLWYDPGNQLFVWTESGSPASGRWATVVPSADSLGFTVNAGDGLVGGGFPTTSPAEIVISVGKGTGINFGSPGDGSPRGAIHADPTQIDHDSLLNFVANEHVDHTSVVITAGNGLTTSTGSPADGLTGSITFDIGAGDGIDVLADAVRTDATVLLVSGSPANQTTTGNYTVSNAQVRADNATSPGSGTVAYTFTDDLDTGMMKTGSDQLAFITGGNERIQIRSNGVMRAGTASYESLVTEDDDIPNRQYVDNLGGGGVSPTETTHVGTSTITGLTAEKKYLVYAYGVLPDKGNGTVPVNAINIRSGITLGAGSLLASIPSISTYRGSGGGSTPSFNWMDGNGLSQVGVVIDTSGGITSINIQLDDGSGHGGGTAYASYSIAVQLGNP